LNRREFKRNNFTAQDVQTRLHSRTYGSVIYTELIRKYILTINLLHYVCFGMLQRNEYYCRQCFDYHQLLLTGSRGYAAHNSARRWWNDFRRIRMSAALKRAIDVQPRVWNSSKKQPRTIESIEANAYFARGEYLFLNVMWHPRLPHLAVRLPIEGTKSQ